VEDRWHSIGDREKVSPESFGIRIRDPANSEIPIEVTGVERSTHTCIGVSAHRVSGVGKFKVHDIASSEIRDRAEVPIGTGRSQR
jgi:hypothetical protein